MKASSLRFAVVGLLSLLFANNVVAHSEAPDSINYISEIENLKIHTDSERVSHLSDFDLTFHLHNQRQRLKLDLHPNHNILGENAHVQYLDSQGNLRRSEEIQRHEHKVFKGTCYVETEDGNWDEVGWARIYLQQDGAKPLMQGSFSVQDDVHHIQLRSAYSKVRRRSDVPAREGLEESMIVYRGSDMVSAHTKRDNITSPSCGADKLDFNSYALPDLQGRSATLGSFYSPKKRQSGNIGTGNLRGTIGNNLGCPTEERVALLGIATDCTYTASFPNEAAIRQNLIQVVNSASAVYEEQFNIALGLKNVTILEGNCPSTASSITPWNLPCSQGTIETRLDSFSQWRGGLGDDNAYWTMMSTCASGSSVGLAWLGQICVSTLRGYGGQSVSGANVVVRTQSEWQVFAHETAHTFGAVHDCDTSLCAQTSSRTSSCCPISSSGCDAGGQYLMSPVSGRSLSQFSPCTVGNICSGIGRSRVRSSCLVPNRNLTTITGSQCGNGIVEAGEDCDCGGPEGCGANSCCNPTTCRFAGSAVCDDSNDACCTSCQYTPANTVCRAAVGECDQQETCSGSSGTCPRDTYRPNGDSCGGGNGLACASGECTSRDLQCSSVYDTQADQNYTRACQSLRGTCTLTCETSSSSTFCAALQQNFLDGTPCGSSSNTCSNGQCSSSSSNGSGSGSGSGDNNNDSGGSGSSWFDRNRTLVIGLAAGIGGLLVLIVLSCCISSCRKSRKRKQMAALPPRPMTQQPPQWGAFPPPVYAPPRTGTFRYA